MTVAVSMLLFLLFCYIISIDENTCSYIIITRVDIYLRRSHSSDSSQ